MYVESGSGGFLASVIFCLEQMLWVGPLRPCPINACAYAQ